MTPFRALLVAIGAVALGIVSAWAGFGPGQLYEATGWLIAGWTCVACGIAGSRIASWSGVGPAITVAGLLWLVPDGSGCLNVEPLSHRCVALTAPDAVAVAIGLLWVVPLTHAIVRFPSGRVTSWSVAVAVAVWLLAVAAASVSGADGSLTSTTGALSLAVAGTSVVLLGSLRTLEAQRGPRTADAALGLGASLARAVGDPTLAIAIRTPTGDGWMDLGGFTIESPHTSPTFTPITRHGVEVARVSHDPSALADEGIRAAVLTAVELEAHNVRLRATLEAQMRSLDESRHRLVDAGLQERRALAAQVEAEVIQRLDGIARRLDVLNSNGAIQSAALLRARESIAATRSDVTTLAAGVYPTDLETLGLISSVRALAMSAGFDVTVEGSTTPPSEPVVGATLYFVCAEALANAQRHAAASHVRITIDQTLTTVRAEIVDDGRGGADPTAGSGLRGLRDRVEALGGTLVIESQVGTGTRLEATIPAAPEAH